MSPELTRLIERSATLSLQERLELATYLQASQNTPDRWDLSETAITRRNTELRKVLAQWRDMGDEVEQTGLLHSRYVYYPSRSIDCIQMFVCEA